MFIGFQSLVILLLIFKKFLIKTKTSLAEFDSNNDSPRIINGFLEFKISFETS